MKVALITVFVLATTCVAQEWKKQSFDYSADDVYRAAERVLLKKHRVDFTDPDKRVIRFYIGTTAWSWGYNMTFAVDDANVDKASAEIVVEKVGGPAFSWGSGKKEVRKIFTWIDDELKSAERRRSTAHEK